MKSILLATVASLALTGVGFAQEAKAPVVTPDPAASAAETATSKAVDAAKEAAQAADAAVAEAAKAAKDAASDAADVAGDLASEAMQAAKDAAQTADKVAAEAATEAGEAADAAVQAASDATKPAAPVTPPDVKAPAISAEAPGVLSSWITSRHVWTTNQPSTTAWSDPQLTERPADWQDIAKISDIVLDDSENTVGYIADIGGFLGIGAKKVLLGRDAIHLVTIGNDSFYATNFTKEELQALPDFNDATVRK